MHVCVRPGGVYISICPCSFMSVSQQVLGCEKATATLCCCMIVQFTVSIWKHPPSECVYVLVFAASEQHSHKYSMDACPLRPSVIQKEKLTVENAICKRGNVIYTRITSSDQWTVYFVLVICVCAYVCQLDWIVELKLLHFIKSLSILPLCCMYASTQNVSTKSLSWTLKTCWVLVHESLCGSCCSWLLFFISFYSSLFSLSLFIIFIMV